jgi:hypothetical protein
MKLRSPLAAGQQGEHQSGQSSGLQRTFYFTGRDIAISQVEISPAATPRDII